MPNIKVRTLAGTESESDLSLTISDESFEYLSNSGAEKIRVSCYLDRDWPRVEKMYEELSLGDSCKDAFKITSVSPGSKTRKSIRLPEQMLTGEQLTLQVVRISK